MKQVLISGLLLFINSFAFGKPIKGHIVILGDSLAAGFGASTAALRPAGCLAQLPHKKVFDLSVSGSRSEDVLRKVKQAKEHNPELIFISAGGNDTMADAFRPGAYPPSKTLKVMEQIFDQLKETGATVVYLGLHLRLKGAERLEKISDLARNKGIVVFDGMEGFWGGTQFMADQIHPNDRGYKLICDRLLTTLKGKYP